MSCLKSNFKGLANVQAPKYATTVHLIITFIRSVPQICCNELTFQQVTFGATARKMIVGRREAYCQAEVVRTIMNATRIYVEIKENALDLNTLTCAEMIETVKLATGAEASHLPGAWPVFYNA